MEDQRFKTFRHIETVRNYLNTVIRELLNRQESHDQSKFWPEESKRFDEAGDLRKLTYGSPEYFANLDKIKPAIQHHYQHNKHHPEYWNDGIINMNLVDLIEMLVDWKASSMRHDDGDIFRSIEINQKRFGYSNELKEILINTAQWLETSSTYHRAEES